MVPLDGWLLAPARVSLLFSNRRAIWNRSGHGRP